MIVEIKGVSKKFGDQEVLRDIHLSIPEHSVFGFIGANGAGKTTLMKRSILFLVSLGQMVLEKRRS